MAGVDRWFPVRFDLVEQEEFRRLCYTATAALLHLHYHLAEHLSLVDAGFRSGAFVRADEKMAADLGMSVRAFRSARVQLGKLGWIEYRKGYQDKAGNHRATAYLGAKYARSTRGIRCAAFPRRTWKRLTEWLSGGRLTHQDATACAFLLYIWELLGGRSVGHVTLARRDVARLTGMSDRAFIAALKKLQRSELSTLSFSLVCQHNEIIASDLRFSPEMKQEMEADDAVRVMQIQ